MMGKTIIMKTQDRDIRVADIKSDYIGNIISSVSLCPNINKIVLFGSAIGEGCIDHSDIDIAVFGSKAKSQMFASKGYKDFIHSIVSYGGAQDYDILYFDDRKSYDDSIMSDIQRGEVLYLKGVDLYG